MVEQLDFAARMQQGGMATLLGVGTVFVILLLLWIIVEIMHRIFMAVERRKTPKAEAVQPVVQPALQLEEEDETELVAVITAAIAASLNTSASNFKIKSFRRVGSNFRK